MKAPHNAVKAGAAAPKKGKARTAPTVSGPKITRQNKSPNGSSGAAKGKVIDSRSKVIGCGHGAKIGLVTYTSAPEKVQALKALRDEMPGSSGATQEKRILEALSRWSLSTFEASRYLDAFDPRARVMGLRNKGHSITTHWVLQRTECGRPHRIGVYVLQRGAAPAPAGDPPPTLCPGASVFTDLAESA